MATRGQRPKSTVLKLVSGNPGGRALPAAIPDELKRKTPLVPPKKLTKAQRTLWTRFIDTAWWLTDHDVTTAYMWVRLQADLLKAREMKASMIAQIRSLANE